MFRKTILILILTFLCIIVLIVENNVWIEMKIKDNIIKIIDNNIINKNIMDSRNNDNYYITDCSLNEDRYIYTYKYCIDVYLRNFNCILSIKTHECKIFYQRTYKVLISDTIVDLPLDLKQEKMKYPIIIIDPMITNMKTQKEYYSYIENSSRINDEILKIENIELEYLLDLMNGTKCFTNEVNVLFSKL